MMRESFKYLLKFYIIFKSLLFLPALILSEIRSPWRKSLEPSCQCMIILNISYYYFIVNFFRKIQHPSKAFGELGTKVNAFFSPLVVKTGKRVPTMEEARVFFRNNPCSSELGSLLAAKFERSPEQIRNKLRCLNKAIHSRRIWYCFFLMYI